MNSDYSVVEALAKTKVYHHYRKAFMGVAGLPLSLRAVGSGQVSHGGIKNENGFCAILAQQNRTCGNCLRMQQKLRENAVHRPYSIACGAGVFETAVPVRMGEKLVGLLHTGQAVESTRAHLGKRVLSAKEYASAVGMLCVFAEHLAIVSNQLLIQGETAEPLIITRAKRFIHDSYSEDLSLDQVTKTVSVSKFYFCKLFKRTTGVTFTEYLSSVRIEKAKNLLLHRNLRICEIGFDVGFQSLTHFNRVFKGMVGSSPTEYRDLLPAAGTANCCRT